MSSSRPSILAIREQAEPQGQSPFSADLAAENARLKRELQKAEMERDILRSRAHLRIGLPVTFGFVDEHRHLWPARKICAVLDVSVSGSYAWRNRPESKRSIETRALLSDICCEDSAIDEPQGELPGERVHGKLLPHDDGRAPASPRLSHAGRGTPGPVRLHRGFLQFTAPACRATLQITDRHGAHGGLTPSTFSGQDHLFHSRTGGAPGLFDLPCCQTVSLVASLIEMDGLDWPMPEHSTLCRRQAQIAMQIPYRCPGQPLNLLIDSTGNRFRGDGERLARKHGATRRREWRKVHVGMGTATSDIRAVEFTSSRQGVSAILPEVLARIPAREDIETVTADAACDTRRSHAAILEHSAEPIMPIRRNGRARKPDALHRAHTTRS